MFESGTIVAVKPFDLVTLGAKLGTPGEPWDVACCPSLAAAPYPNPAGALVPHLRGTEYEARTNAANGIADAAARAKAWADLEADLMRDDPPVAVYALTSSDSRAHVRSSRAMLA